MKKFIDNTIATVTLISFVVLMAVGLWFMQGGDLKDLKEGCFDTQGC